MSLVTVLLAFLAPIVRPKPAPEKTAAELIFDNVELKREVKALEGEVDRLLQLNEAAAGRIQELEAERDSALRRLDEARDMLAALAAHRIDRQLNPPAGLDYASYQQAQYQQAMAAAQRNQLSQAQYNAQQAMNAQNFAGLLGAQMPAAPAAMLEFCNCVPARHDMFLRPGDGC